MKTYQIEVQRIKAMSNAHGLVEMRLDATVLPRPGRDDDTGTTLTLSEETARVLQLLLKQQLAEFDKRKARSQR